MYHRRNVRTSARAVRARSARFRLRPCLLVAAACLAASACSPGADYPSIFPAIHDMPPPRADTPLDPVQVQQATEDLISERNHLNGEAHTAGQKETVNSSAAATKPQPARSPAVGQAAGDRQSGMTASSQTAGTETK